LKIAFTADNHLTTQSRNPERFAALADILQQCGKHQVKLLIIAGDLFDQSLPNYSEFEALYKKHRPLDLTTAIIPGNHDEDLNPGAIAGDGLLVYSESVLQPLNDSRKILFIPYQGNQTMGMVIAQYADAITDQRWILVGHGDWTSGINTPDPYEKGTYMPLTRMDLKSYQPEMVFLGHIHLPQDGKEVSYPGSPCPLNISETGLRRFLILDTDRGEITPHIVDSPLIYFDERFIILPVGNDLEYLEENVKNRIQNWDLPPGWENRVQVRVEISGSAISDRQKILDSVKQGFKSFSFYQGNDPVMNNLTHSQDKDRAEISLQIQDWIEKKDWTEDLLNPSKSQILEEALKVIYPRGK